MKSNPIIINNSSQLYKNFFEFTKLQIEVGDSHPAYALLRELFKIEKLPQIIKIWRCLIFVAFDHLGSAEKMWTEYPEPKIIKNPQFMTTGIARRGFRGNTYWADMINSVSNNGELKSIIESHANKGEIEGWISLRNWFEQFKHNGSWSSYKFADLMTHVCGYKLKADSIGENHCVLQAASLLTGKEQKECMSDIELQGQLLNYAKNHHSKINGLEELETALCDFISFLQGRYYIGMEIDSQMEQIPDKKIWWEARKLAFNKKFLGENNNYVGIRKGHQPIYKLSGIIKWWN